jgi:putative aldouronate transport system substrate-binding protein
MKKFKSMFAIVLVSLLVFLAACSGSNSGSGGSSGNEGNAGSQGAAGSQKEETAEKPTEITILTEFTIAQPPAPDNPVLKEFEKRTNTKLKITWVPGPDYNDRQNVVLASGDFPDLLRLTDVTVPQFQTLVKQGAFWDLTPFLQDYKNLMEIPKSVWDSTTIDGKNYVIPVVRPLNGFAFPAIRKDWLDKLGLEVPKTMDELYEVMKAFKEHKPDGKDTTYGYTMRGHDFIKNIFNSANGKWKLVDGRLVDVTLEPGTREAILYKKKLYDEGLIPSDYVVMKDDQFWELATSGRAGLTSETIEALWRWTYDQWKRDPEVEWLPLVSLAASADSEQFVTQYRGYIGVLAIPKKVPEEKVRKILELLDFGASEEGGTLSLYGIEGVHYTVEDGFYVTTEQAVKDSVGVGAFGKIFMRYDPYMYAFAPGMTKEVFERNKQIIDERGKISVPDPSVGLVSETDIKAGADYTKKIDDLKTQIIMGKLDISAWDQFVNDLKQDATYQKIIEEMNAAYQERLAKLNN